MDDGDGEEETVPGGTAVTTAGPPAEEGWVQLRGALLGLGGLWLAAMAGFTALQAAMYGLTVEPIYLLGAVLAAGVAVAAAAGSLRAFGIK
ncbi:MAG: hypothetical protein PPP58_05045 [Natronomonas sp.]